MISDTYLKPSARVLALDLGAEVRITKGSQNYILRSDASSCFTNLDGSTLELKNPELRQAIDWHVANQLVLGRNGVVYRQPCLPMGSGAASDIASAELIPIDMTVMAMEENAKYYRCMDDILVIVRNGSTPPEVLIDAMDRVSPCPLEHEAAYGVNEKCTFMNMDLRLVYGSRLNMIDVECHLWHKPTATPPIIPSTSETPKPIRMATHKDYVTTMAIIEKTKKGFEERKDRYLSRLRFFVPRMEYLKLAKISWSIRGKYIAGAPMILAGMNPIRRKRRRITFSLYTGISRTAAHKKLCTRRARRELKAQTDQMFLDADLADDCNLTDIGFCLVPAQSRPLMRLHQNDLWEEKYLRPSSVLQLMRSSDIRRSASHIVAQDLAVRDLEDLDDAEF
jgi:hypothetical protein